MFGLSLRPTPPKAPPPVALATRYSWWPRLPGRERSDTREPIPPSDSLTWSKSAWQPIPLSSWSYSDRGFVPAFATLGAKIYFSFFTATGCGRGFFLGPRSTFIPARILPNFFVDWRRYCGFCYKIDPGCILPTWITRPGLNDYRNVRLQF